MSINQLQKYKKKNVHCTHISCIRVDLGMQSDKYMYRGLKREMHLIKIFSIQI